MRMKSTILGCFAIAASLLANANNGNNGIGEENSKKSDMMGCVLHNETRKPLSDVCITAYLSSKKEQVITTSSNGSYSFENLKPGIYKFVFQKDGYRKVVKDHVMIKTDNGFQLNIQMFETEDFNFMPGAFNFPMPQ